MPRLFILSDHIGIGKTTYLESIVEDLPSQYSGLLSPIYKGLRHFYFISEKKYIKFECSDHYETQNNLIRVGRHKFYKSAFKEANACLDDSVKMTDRILIIDEIGYLELKEQGLHTSVYELTHKSDLNLTYLFVIRQKLLEEVIDFYNLLPIEIFSLKDLISRGSIHKLLKNEINPGI